MSDAKKIARHGEYIAMQGNDDPSVFWITWSGKDGLATDYRMKDAADTKRLAKLLNDQSHLLDYKKLAEGYRIYVASSWRNKIQPDVVLALRNDGHDVYDFCNPTAGDKGFHWSEIDVDWQNWTPGQFVRALNHPLARSGFAKDKEALDWANCGVLVMPCGRSAHLEAGYLIGQGKPVWIFLSDGEPELMYKLGTGHFTDLSSLTAAFREAIESEADDE